MKRQEADNNVIEKDKELTYHHWIDWYTSTIPNQRFGFQRMVTPQTGDPYDEWFISPPLKDLILGPDQKGLYSVGNCFDSTFLFAMITAAQAYYTSLKDGGDCNYAGTFYFSALIEAKQYENNNFGFLPDEIDFRPRSYDSDQDKTEREKKKARWIRWVSNDYPFNKNDTPESILPKMSKNWIYLNSDFSCADQDESKKKFYLKFSKFTLKNPLCPIVRIHLPHWKEEDD